MFFQFIKWGLENICDPIREWFSQYEIIYLIRYKVIA